MFFQMVKVSFMMRNTSDKIILLVSSVAVITLCHLEDKKAHFLLTCITVAKKAHFYLLMQLHTSVDNDTNKKLFKKHGILHISQDE